MTAWRGCSNSFPRATGPDGLSLLVIRSQQRHQAEFISLREAPMCRMLLAAALTLSLPALADQITVIADGVLVRRGEQAWLKISSQQYPLQFPTSDMRRFALALHNRSVHVEGTLETIPQGRAGAGQVYIRPSTLVQSQAGGYEGQYGYSRGRGNNYTDTIVVPRRQTGPIPSRSYPRY